MPPLADSPTVATAWLDSGTPDVVILILTELANHPRACPLAVDLAARLNLDIVAVWNALLEAERGGWAECWPDDPRGPSVVLSSRSASRLGLTLSDDGQVWLTQGKTNWSYPDRMPRFNVMTDCEKPDESGMLAFLVDPEALGGLDSIIWMERLALEAARLEAEQQARPQPDGLEKLAAAWQGWGTAIDQARLPHLQLIMGLGPTWPIAWEDGPCPVCQGRSIPLAAYCSVCHRSGLDRILTVVAEPPPDPAGDAVVPISRRAGKVKGKRRAEPIRFRDLIPGKAKG